MNKGGNKFFDVLAKRAELSVVGKAFIGVVGGIVLLFLTLFKKCNEREDDFIPLMDKWVEYNVLDPITLLDSNKRVRHFKKLGVQENQIDSIGEFMFWRLKGGKIIHSLNHQEVDSLKKLHQSVFKKDMTSIKYYYIKSIDSSDFIIGIKDSLIFDLAPM